eukprot:5486251-Pleurochrysis_carterae.AAC.4
MGSSTVLDGESATAYESAREGTFGSLACACVVCLRSCSTVSAASTAVRDASSSSIACTVSRWAIGHSRELLLLGDAGLSLETLAMQMAAAKQARA